ncbi:putative Mediator of RNA polymerase II transcription subunit 6 [Hypsibius exemplaris]|uniref:Mediator of RNA polymerase II transcription subunit 6 n=1 Tax=Hypsibius exemplaris TaxID=2072580 RepID=A0A1W0WYE6_HYPEX|nr:putative Mediator of RNA polymerase II transcription subunit 6 [Hypsibius exemplaris]
MNASKQNNVSSAVSLNPKDTDLLLSWSDAIWVPHLTSANVMEYFAQPSNPFYDPQCNNEIIRMQRQSLDQLKWGFFFCFFFRCFPPHLLQVNLHSFYRNMVGIEYELAHAQDPILYIIKRQQRISPTDGTRPLVRHQFPAPQYLALPLHRPAELNSFVRFHPANGYHWGIKPPTGSNISFVPMDATRKEPEEAGTQFQRKNVDGILAPLTQRFPSSRCRRRSIRLDLAVRWRPSSSRQPTCQHRRRVRNRPSETTVAPLPAGSDRAQNHQLFNAVKNSR